MSKGKTTCSSLGRYHFFDFSETATQGAELPTTYGWRSGTIAAGASFIIWPFAVDGETTLPNGFGDVMNFRGEQRLAGMKVNFPDSSGSMFTLRFTPNFYSESNYLLVTYLGGNLICGGETACASWTVEALDGSVDTAQPYCCKVSSLQAIAALPNGNNSIYYGAFHMPSRSPSPFCRRNSPSKSRSPRKTDAAAGACRDHAPETTSAVFRKYANVFSPPVPPFAQTDTVLHPGCGSALSRAPAPWSFLCRRLRGLRNQPPGGRIPTCKLQLV